MSCPFFYLPSLFHRPQFLQFSPFLRHLFLVHADQDMTGLMNCKCPLQHLHALTDRIDACLSVQFKSKGFYMAANDSEALFQVFLIRMDKKEVIHIPDITADAKLLGNQMVEIIQYRKFSQL